MSQGRSSCTLHRVMKQLCAYLGHLVAVKQMETQLHPFEPAREKIREPPSSKAKMHLHELYKQAQTRVITFLHRWACVCTPEPEDNRNKSSNLSTV
eukprot:1145055-Pelagomonas_calceolata.AAC.1